MIDSTIIAATTRRMTSFGVVKESKWIEPSFMQFEYNSEADLALLRTFPYLWDLRYWKSLKDPDEIMEWINQIERWNNNASNGLADAKGACNNLRYNIRHLLKLGKVSKYKIIKAMLDNPYVRNKERMGEML